MESPDAPVSNSPKTRTAGWQIIGLIVITFALGLGLGYVVWGYPLQNKVDSLQTTLSQSQAASATQSVSATQSAVQDQSAVEIPKNVKRYSIPVDNDPALGPSNAPITVIEFSDFECPYCRKWQVEVFPQLLSQYGDKIRFVYKDFPLYENHPDAEPAAEAANCASDQNKYWEFHNLLFQGDSLGTSVYDAYAKQVGLDINQFKQCIDQHTYQKEIKDDIDFASTLGISSTPTFFINGLAVIGAQPFQVFQQIIDLELAGKIPK